MSEQAHLSELQRKHRNLDDKISVELGHPSVSDLRIADLKRQKLRLKEEIERVQATAH